MWIYYALKAKETLTQQNFHSLFHAFHAKILLIICILSTIIVEVLNDSDP